MNVPGYITPEAMYSKPIYDAITDRAAEYVGGLGLPHDSVLRLAEITFHFRNPEAEIDRVTARNFVDIHEQGFLEVELANMRTQPPELAIYSIQENGRVHPLVPSQTFGVRFFENPEFYIHQLDGAHLEATLR